MSTNLGPIEGAWDVQSQIRQIGTVLHLPELQSRMAFRMPRRDRGDFVGVIVTKTLAQLPLEGLTPREVDVCIGKYLQSPSVLELIEEQADQWGGSLGFTSCTLSCDALRKATNDESKSLKSKKWPYMKS